MSLAGVPVSCLLCAVSAFRATMLSYGRGAAFHVHPSSGILNPFEELVVEITAYNNMWGEYQDNLICEVGVMVRSCQDGPVAGALMCTLKD